MTDDDLSGWREPDAALVQAALARIGDQQHRRVFFERLENPRWVSALDAQHVFDSPPEMITDAAGGEAWAPWPEGEYLVRMAPLAPQAVRRLLARVTDSDNPYVHELVLEAALSLPPEQARTLVHAIDGYLANGTLRNSGRVVELIESFANAGLRKPAVRLAQAAFRPRPVDAPDGGGPLRRRSVAVGLEPYWYEELLPRLVTALDPVLGDSVLTMLAAWLETFQEVTGDYSAERGSDLSYLWRPAIGDHTQNNRYHAFGDALVEVVRDRAMADLARGRSLTEVLATLERAGQPLLRRIALHVLARSAAEASAAREEGFQRLLEPHVMDHAAYRHEYAELGRAVLPLVSETQAKDWEAMALTGPPVSDDVMKDRTQSRLQAEEDLTTALQRYREVWQLNLLSAIGHEFLPEGAAAYLRDLVAKYGQPEHPDFSSYTSTWVGPSSPVTDDGLAKKTVGEILAFLTDWTPDGVERWGPSKEGLSRTLQDVVAGRAYEFSVVAPEVALLDPTYVRAFFSGLRSAVSEGARIDWASVVEAAAMVSRNVDDGSNFEGGMDEDGVWRFAQESAVALVERGAESVDNGLPSELLLLALEAIAPLVNHPDPTPEHEEKYGGSNMDPLTLSLNTTRPSALRTVLQVLSRARDLLDQGGAEPQPQAVIEEGLRLLQSRLRPVRDASLATAAVFGEGLGRLIWIHADWTSEHTQELLSDDAFGDVVLSVALSVYRPSKAILDVVETAARRVIERVASGGIAVSGWRTDRSLEELIGDALVLLRIQGGIRSDDPLLTYFFSTASTRARARVLGHLGWLLLQSEDIPAENLDRAIELWDSRAQAVAADRTSVDELAEFYWWVRSERFDHTWWLPRLLQASASDEFDAAGMIGEVLEDAAPTAPRQVVEILETLLAKQGQKPLARYELVEHAPAIIAEALDSEDADAIAAGQRVMDLLGRGGHLRIVELVEQRRSR